jgi:hypothetical protein
VSGTNLTITNNLDVIGNTILTDVSGTNLSLSSNLDVIGNTILTDVSGTNLSLTHRLDVLGNATFVNMFGTNLGITDVLNVTGRTILIDVSGTNLSLSNDIDVSGNATFTNISMSNILNIGGTTFERSGSDFNVQTGSNMTTLSDGGMGWVYPSDMRLKENVSNMHGNLEKLQDMSGYEFNYIDHSETHYGVIAQEVKEVFPHAVHEKESGMLGVNYTELVPVLINCIKELNTNTNKMQKQMDHMAAEIKVLKQNQCRFMH